MDFSINEMQRRFSNLEKLLDKNKLDGAILLGDSTVNAPFINTSLRYFTQHDIIDSIQVLLYLKGKEPTVFTSSPLQMAGDKNRSYLKNHVVCMDQAAALVDAIAGAGLSEGRLGCMMDMLPASWYLKLQDAFPDMQLVEIKSDLTSLHYEKSEEEIEKARKSAQMADAAYERALSVLKPGAAECEVTAEIMYETNRQGACKNFMLIASGQEQSVFTNGLPNLYPASKRVLQENDVVIMEITPQYDAYWTQLLRTVCLGSQPSATTAAMHRLCVEVLKDSLDMIVPTTTPKQIWEHMNRSVSAAGYELDFSIGHTCSVDLVDERLNPMNERKLNAGETIIMHPCIKTKDGGACFTWGQTYLVTENGAVSLNHAGDELVCTG